jgi:hypothetical protein
MEMMQQYQSLIGTMQWTISIGHMDITTPSWLSPVFALCPDVATWTMSNKSMATCPKWRKQLFVCALTNRTTLGFCNKM